MNLLMRTLTVASLTPGCGSLSAGLGQSAPSAISQRGSAQQKWALVLHGGAGVITRSSMTAELDASYRAGIKEALSAAAGVLDKGGSSLDAVETAIKLLEDNPLFNAGRGAVFAADGTNQLDAAIMEGQTMRAGSVADVQRTRHPISLARAVMEQSPHLMLIGSGADAFAEHVHLEQVPPSFFFTERRWQELVRQLEKDGSPIPPRPAGAPPPQPSPSPLWKGLRRTSTARSASSRSTAAATSRPARLPAASRASVGTELATHPLSAREPTPRISRVRCRQPARANTSSGLPWRAPSAPLCSTRA